MFARPIVSSSVRAAADIKGRTLEAAAYEELLSKMSAAHHACQCRHSFLKHDGRRSSCSLLNSLAESLRLG